MENSKRPSPFDTAGPVKKIKKSKSLLPYQGENLTAANLGQAIPDLPYAKQLSDLNIICRYSHHTRRKFEIEYRMWRTARALSFADVLWLSDYQTQSAQSTSKLHASTERASSAAVTFHEIFFNAIHAADMDLAAAAAACTIDYVIISYVTAIKLEVFLSGFPELHDIFKECCTFLSSFQRSHANAFDHDTARVNTGGRIVTAASSSTGSGALVAGDSTRSLGALEATAPSNTANSNRSQVDVVGAGDRDTADYNLHIEASVVKGVDELPEWEKVHSCPAVKLYLETMFASIGQDWQISEADDGLQTHGILLYGRPGTGKSLLAEGIARFSGFKFYNVSMGDINSKWQGESERYIAALFAHASSNQPSLIFIDEIDGITRNRGESDTASTSAIRSSFLTEWGIVQRRGVRVLVLGTSNHPDQLDSAFMRRLSVRLWIKGPELPQRVNMLKSMLSRRDSQVTDSEIEKICDLNNMRKFTGFQVLMCVHSAINIAKVDCFRTDRWTTTQIQGREALVPIIGQPTSGSVLVKKFSELTPEERKMVRYRPIVAADLTEACLMAGDEDDTTAHFTLLAWSMKYETKMNMCRRYLGIEPPVNI